MCVLMAMKFYYFKKRLSVASKELPDEDEDGEVKMDSMNKRVL